MVLEHGHEAFHGVLLQPEGSAPSAFNKIEGMLLATPARTCFSELPRTSDVLQH